MSIGMSISQFLKKTGIALNVVLNDQKTLDLPAPYNLDATAINGYISVHQTVNNAEEIAKGTHLLSPDWNPKNFKIGCRNTAWANSGRKIFA
jgi:hypothetical protein